MNEIVINTSRPYSVLVGKSILHQLGAEIKKITEASKIAVVSDSNVWPIYGNAVLSALKIAGYTEVYPFIIQAGEKSKNSQNFINALEFFAENHITRSDCIIALGGGVVGDLAGFAAACYLRGIDYIQVPTTLLACVDSSVGGKTAIDLQNGKNLAGAFYQPKLVFCDIDTLSTLPKAVFRDGCAEVIKYGILYDNELFDHLTLHGFDFDRQWVISRCVELKRDVVLSDEFDRGDRQKLNLGHTFGHGIEASSKFTVSHGQAVAIGMAIISRAATKKGICSLEDKDKILSLLSAFDLPITTTVAADDIYRNALVDKKRNADTVNLVIPKRISDCAIVPTKVETLMEIICAGL